MVFVMIVYRNHHPDSRMKVFFLLIVFSGIPVVSTLKSSHSSPSVRPSVRAYISHDALPHAVHPYNVNNAETASMV